MKVDLKSGLKQQLAKQIEKKTAFEIDGWPPNSTGFFFQPARPQPPHASQSADTPSNREDR